MIGTFEVRLGDLIEVPHAALVIIPSIKILRIFALGPLHLGTPNCRL